MDRSHLAPPGGEVRCAKCLTVWFQAVSDSDVSLDQDLEEARLVERNDAGAVPETPGEKTARAARRSRLALVAGLGALALFFGTFFWAAIAFRYEIATVWPQSANLYGLINLPVNVHGLDFADITSNRLIENGESVLQISGRVINVSERQLTVPPIHVSLRDTQERELYGWTVSAGVAMLGPGQWSGFLARLPNPPAEVARTELSFVPGSAP